MPNRIITYRNPLSVRFTELYISDLHIPYHCRRAWDLALYVSETLKPDLFYVGGDFIDFYPISDFCKDPTRQTSLQQELDLGAAALEELWSTSPLAQRIFHEGNHETRMTRYTWKHAPAFASLRSHKIEEQLNLAARNCTFVPNGSLFKIGELYHAHGNEFGKAGGPHPARAIFMRTHLNLIFGHTHKLQPHYETNPLGRMWGAFNNGCLCDMNPEYVAFPQWQQSVTRVIYDKSGLFHVDQIPFFRNKKGTLCCLLDGDVLSV